MDMKGVKSSMISHVGYDEKTRQLAVRFSNGNIYNYQGVPPATHTELVAAKSVGRHFGIAVRGKYPFSSR